MVEVDPFRIAVPDATLDDLAARLGRARLPSPPILDGGESAATIRRVETLIEYWKTGYDWRAQERRLNAVPQFRATIDGVGIHFAHVPGAGPDPLPLLLTNGWPSSFAEYVGVLGPLTDPAAHGGDPADSFSVVVPALPGYGFSDRCLDRHLDRAVIADLFHRLMVDRLGYRRYVAHGDDIGGGVVNRLGTGPRDELLAIQTANWMDPHVGPGRSPADPGGAGLPGRRAGVGPHRGGVRARPGHPAADPRVRAERLPRRARRLDPGEVADLDRPGDPAPGRATFRPYRLSSSI
jgi:hypothetical protein